MSMKQAGKDLFAEFQKTNWAPFISYRVKIRLHDIVGGIPKNGQLIEAWINARNKELSKEARKELADATKADMQLLKDEKGDAHAIGFRSDKEKGLFIEGRQIKSMLKEVGNIIKGIAPGGKKKEKVEGQKKSKLVDAEGITNLKSKVAERFFVVDDCLFLGVMEPTRMGEKPIQVETRLGPRSSIKRFDIVEDVEIEFTLQRSRDDVVPVSTLLAIMQYAQKSGLGAMRSQGYGCFDVVEVVLLEDE